MIAIVIFAVGATLVLCSARACEDPFTPRDDSAWLDVLLFALVLAGVVAAHVKRKHDEANED